MKTRTTHPLGLLAMTAIAAAALTACSGGDDDRGPDTEQPQANGSIAAELQTNAQSCGLDAINVTVTKLRFHTDPTAAPGATGWVEMPFSPAKKLNLLHLPAVLSGATTALGSVSLAPGGYSQVRAVLDTSAGANTVRVAGAAADTALETAAVLGSDGVKIASDFIVASGKPTQAVLDFNACGSVQQRGAAYVFKPWAGTVPAALNGITGFIDKAVLNSGVTITAQVTGSIYATTVPNPTTGEFRLPRLPAANYEVVIQGKDRATSVVGVVPVRAGESTAISTAAAPLTLVASPVSTITGRIVFTAPAVAPDSGAWVQASQSISASTTIGNAATTVTYRFQPVDLANGTYTLTNLPRNSVMYALYKPATTLVPAAAVTAGLNGRFRVESLVTGFTPKTSATANINASTGNVAATDIVVP